MLQYAVRRVKARPHLYHNANDKRCNYEPIRISEQH